MPSTTVSKDGETWLIDEDGGRYLLSTSTDAVTDPTQASVDLADDNASGVLSITTSNGSTSTVAYVTPAGLQRVETNLTGFLPFAPRTVDCRSQASPFIRPTVGSGPVTWVYEPVREADLFATATATVPALMELDFLLSIEPTTATSDIYGYTPGVSTSAPRFPDAVMPDASNTGIPPGIDPLLPVTAAYTTGGSGIIRGLDFKGQVTVNSGHTVQFIECNVRGKIVANGDADFLHCDIGATNAGQYTPGVTIGGARFNRCNMFGFGDQANVGNAVGRRQMQWLDSFIHDCRTYIDAGQTADETGRKNSHSDGLQLGTPTSGGGPGQGYLVDHCCIFGWSFMDEPSVGLVDPLPTRSSGPHWGDITPYGGNGTTGKMFDHGYTNSGIIVNAQGSASGPVSDVTITRNWFFGQFAKPIIISSDATGVVINDNIFDRHFRDMTWGGPSGGSAPSRKPISGTNFTGNGGRWYDTGALVPIT